MKYGLYLKTQQCGLVRSKVDHCNSMNLSALIFGMRLLSINSSEVDYIVQGRKLDCPTVHSVVRLAYWVAVACRERGGYTFIQ